MSLPILGYKYLTDRDNVFAVPVFATVPRVHWNSLTTEVTQLGALHQLPLHAPSAQVILTLVAAVPVGPCVG